MNTTKKRFIIDTDTASDDAVALVMAAKHAEITIEAITMVAGNVKLDQGIQNAMYTLSLCEVDVPVYAGMDKPLLRELHTADHVHGADGMSDIGLPLHGFTPESESAIQVLIDTIEAAPNEITLVCLAPLTNIAMALLQKPSIASKVKECVIMGGVGEGRGNVTPIAEYNFWADPEAAKIVFESGMPITMVGWDISREYAVFDDNDVAEVRGIDTPLARFSMDIQKTVQEYAQQVSSLKGFDLPDPIAMAVAIDPSIATEVKSAYVKILTNDDESRGQSMMDYIGATGQTPNARIVLKADREGFLQLLRQSVS